MKKLTEVAPNNAMPSGVILLVELLFDVCSNILFNVVLFHRLCCAIDGILLHVLCAQTQAKNHETMSKTFDQAPNAQAGLESRKT